MDKIAVLIPCYNECLTIKKVISDAKSALPEAIIYVYDNNSTDGTAKIAKEAGAIVRYEYNQGKGNVIRRMLREIDASCYIMLDGDDTYPADNMPEMAEVILSKKADMIIGDRLSSTYFTENKRLFHNSGNIIVRKLINAFFNSRINDIMTGYRAFNFNFAKTFAVLSNGFEIETELTIHAIDKNMTILDIPIQYRDRPDGSESKLSTISDGFRVIEMIIKLFKNYRPLAFFGLIALMLTLISIFVFVPTILIPYIETGLVENFPTLIVLGCVEISALLSLFSGLILDTIRQKHLQDFEFKRNQVEYYYKNITGLYEK